MGFWKLLLLLSPSPNWPKGSKRSFWLFWLNSFSSCQCGGGGGRNGYGKEGPLLSLSALVLLKSAEVPPKLKTV